MLNETDKVVEVRLYSPHVCDFVYEREDGTYYVHMSHEESKYFELHINPSKETKWILGEMVHQQFLTNPSELFPWKKKPPR